MSLHATHGILNSTNPELSGVVLSLVNQKGETENGFLRLGDIFNLNLPADLIVLSACQTGLGQEAIRNSQYGAPAPYCELRIGYVTLFLYLEYGWVKQGRYAMFCIKLGL